MFDFSQAIPCPHIDMCPGCFESPSLEPPPVWQEVLSFINPKTLPVCLHKGSPYRWRHRAKVAVRGVRGYPEIGLFKRHSHEVLPIPDCLVHHGSLNRCFEIIREWMIVNSLMPYQEETGMGDLRYLQGAVQRSTGQVQLTLVLNASDPNNEKAFSWKLLANRLWDSHPTFWHSIWLNFNDRKTNTILGPGWSLASGQEQFWETLGKTAVCYGPASFGQANLPLFEKMLTRIIELLPEKACVAELYAGVGAIGLSIAEHCQWVKCSEINPFAESYFNLSRARLPSQIASRLTFTTTPAHRSLSILADAATVIVDPPRKGLDQALFLAFKANRQIKQLLYVSCGWESFKKDSQQLIQEGWTLQNLDGYLFFPGSNHVELLANFMR